MATELDWTAHPRPKGGFLLIAPGNDTVRIVLPVKGQLRQAARLSWARKIIRYGDSAKRLQMVAQYSERFPDIDWSQYIDAKHGSPVLPEKAVRAMAPKPEPKDPVDVPRTVLSVLPYMAHKSPSAAGGTRYQSQAVKERRWSDGTVDYVCAWDECSYEHKNLHSVARHFARKKDHGVVGERALVRDLEYLEPMSKRQIDRIDRLQARIEAAITGLDPTADDFTRQLAVRMVSALAESTDGGMPEPLTPEQIVERVRQLVDNGAYLAAQESARSMAEEVESLRLQLATAEDRAQRAEDRWGALRSIMDEEGD